MKILKYSLIFLISFMALNAGGEKDTKINDQNSFEEFIKDKTAEDIRNIKIVFEISEKDAKNEVWQNVFDQFVKCARIMPEKDKNFNDIFKSITEFLLFLAEQKDNLSGGISLLAEPIINVKN